MLGKRAFPLLLLGLLGLGGVSAADLYGEGGC